MGGKCIRDEDVFERFAFLADLGLGVAVEGFELIVHIVLEGLLGIGIEFHFFGEDEDAAGTETVVDLFDKLVSFGWVEELEGVVHYDNRRILDIDIGDIG